MYKLFRIPQEGKKYEVMVSPFVNLVEVQEYIQKYSKYYPESEQRYWIEKIVSTCPK